ncbi:MAG: hypothetical protein AAB373_02840 [Patescibacteria group bacterium]
MTEEIQAKPTPAEFGPPRINFSSFLLKILASLSGGISGSLILLLILFLASSALDPLTGNFENIESIEISPIFTFILMMMIFLSSTIGNILSTWLLALTEKGRYTRISSAIYQVFIISIIIFILMVPVYFITAATNIAVIPYVVALHIIISAQVSALILEIICNYRYSLVGVYGITFSILSSAGLLFAMAGVLKDPQILLFAILPIVWGSIGFVQSIFTMLYGWMARTYDKDFLSTQTVYGNDYGKEVENEEVEAAPKTKDEAGGDFLRHNE